MEEAPSVEDTPTGKVTPSVLVKKILPTEKNRRQNIYQPSIMIVKRGGKV